MKLPEVDLYLAPDSSYSATYAGPRRRVAASALDWILCVVLFLIASIPAGIVQVIPVVGLDVVGQILAVVPVVVYFAWFFTTGSTLGMRALDIELVVARTGRPPGVARALGRALVAGVLGSATYILYFVLFSFDVEDGDYTATERALIAASAAAFSLGAISKLRSLVDHRRQALDAKPFDLVVIEEIIETSAAPSPWSGLWHRAP